METIQIEQRYWDLSGLDEMAQDWLNTMPDDWPPMPFTSDEMQRLIRAYIAGEHEHSWRLNDDLSDEALYNMKLYIVMCISLRLGEMWLDSLIQEDVIFTGFDDDYNRLQSSSFFPPFKMAKVEVIPDKTD